MNSGNSLANDEMTHLLDRRSGAPLDRPPVTQRLKRHFHANVSKNWADTVLLFCYMITGLLDSAATFIWGSFVSMQTGNTVYLGLGLAAPHADTRWIKALISISSFCLGSFFFARFHRHLGGRRRWVLTTSYFIQLLFVLLAAIIVTLDPHNATSNTFPNSDYSALHWQVLVPLAAVAFQSSGQAVTSRVLQYGGLTSVVLTSNYCDLFSDQKLWAKDNVERNRRVAAPVLLLLGAVGGGFWARSEIGMRGALWTAVGLKALVVGAWVVWQGDVEGE